MTQLRALIGFFLRHWMATVFLTSAAMLAIAHAFETFGGLEPCHMCLQQRTVYWVAMGVSLIALIAGRAPVSRKYDFLFGWALAIVFVCGLEIAVRQAGAEWKFWPVPESCTGGHTVTAEQIKRLLEGAKFAPPRCDVAAWRFLGISMAGWNALVLLKLTVWSVVFGFWRRKTPA